MFINNSISSSSSSQTMNEVDRLSNMPDDILQLILSGLPTTEEVARTSILSRKWRYLWTIIPSIDISCSRAQVFDTQKFKEFVSWVLRANNTQCNLHSFRLHCLDYYNVTTIMQWIDTAIKRNVKSLDLTSGPTSLNPYFKFSICDSLGTLKLCLFKDTISLPAARVRFRSLKVLELKNFYCFDYDFVEQFLRSCPLLEDLSFLYFSYGTNNSLLISHPKLKTLTIRNLVKVRSVEVICPELEVLDYAGHCDHSFTVGNLDSLKKAVILFHESHYVQVSNDIGNRTCLLFFGIAHNVEYLSLNFRFIQCIAAAPYPNVYFPAPLSNLKTFELTTSIDSFTMDVLIRILRCSPIMESLHLIIQKERSSPNNWNLDEEDESRSILTRCLKRVKFLEFRGGKTKLDIARILLEHGYLLEEMVFSWHNKVKNIKLKKTMDQVSTFYKASSTVKLISLPMD